MSTQRPSFAKRDREMKLKDKARAKAERRAAKKAERARGPAPVAADEAPGTPSLDTQTDPASQAASPALGTERR